MHSWRLFILVCLLPALAALVGVIFMPESPRFLLEVSSSDQNTEAEAQSTCLSSAHKCNAAC